MPRDSFGNWVFYAGNPVVTGSTIASAWWNGTYTDIGSSIGASLDRTGNTGGMTGQLKLYTTGSSASLPAVTFDLEQNTGLYWAAAGDVRMTVLGTDLFKWTSTAATSLVSIVATGTAPNGRGGTFTATGADHGIVATGGSSAGNAGAVAIAGGATGFGVQGQGVSGGVGVYALSSSTSVDVLRADGYLDLSHATNPAVNAGFASHVTPKNIIKAWARCHTDGAGNVVASDGFNIASASIATSTLTLGFVTAMANTNYCVVASAFVPGSGAAGVKFAAATSLSTGSVNVACLDASGIINLAVLATDLHVVVLGAQ